MLFNEFKKAKIAFAKTSFLTRSFPDRILDKFTFSVVIFTSANCRWSTRKGGSGGWTIKG